MSPDYSSLSDLELNRKVSDQIMGGVVKNWTTDWNQTMEVVHQIGDFFCLTRYKAGQIGWIASIGRTADGIRECEGKDPKRAICLAALLAVQ